MKSYMTHLVVAATIGALTLAGTAAAAAENAWTLKTDDTHLELTVRDNKPFVTALKNPAQNWNWTPKPSEVPLLGRVVVGNAPRTLTWTYREATLDATTNGTVLTLRFASADPALELKSIWRARPGVGPVEHRQTVRNDSAGAVSFADADLVAADLNLVSDQPAHLFPVAAGTVGIGEHLPLPYQMLQAGKMHGVYLAYDYGCGKFATTATNNQIASRWWAAGIKDTATAPGETFRCPGMMIQTYRGDEDDGANAFRRWFWRYEVTRSLYENPNDPPIGLCEWPYYDGKPDELILRINQYNYAAWGAGFWKTDLWHSQTGHAKSAELAAACRANGLQLCLYWPGAAPSEDAFAAEWKRSKFDYYRTDQGTSKPFSQESYRSFMDFNRKIDNLYAKYGIKYENCSGGGNIRSLDVFRRMTWMTHSDASTPESFFRHIYDWSYMMCPIQIRSDYALGSVYWINQVGESIAEIRGLLLGSIILAPTKIPPAESWERGRPVDFAPATVEHIKKVFSLYNTRQRAVLRGADVYHILPPPATKQWFGIQYHNTLIDKGSVLLWQNGGPTSQAVKLRGFDRDKTYQVTFEDAQEKSGAMTGAQLMDEGLNVTMGTNASEIVWINWAELSASPAELSFAVAHRGDKVAPKQVTLAYRRGPGTHNAFSVRAADPWVKIEPGMGAGDGQTFYVSVDVSDRLADIAQSKIVVSRPDIVERIELPVRTRIGTPAPKVMFMNPPSVRCIVNADGQQRFSLRVHDQFGEPFPAEVQWSVSGGGKIDDQGMFRSDGSTGAFTVTASVKGHPSVTATAQLRVLPINLARWKLDETSGTVAADAWGNFPGTLVGGPAWGPGKHGGALRLNGKGQYVDTGWTLEGLRLPCTFAFWVNPADSQCEYADIFGNHEGSTVGMVMQQQGTETNKYLFGYGSTPGPGGGAGPVQLTANSWQHVAVVCDGTDVIIYVNGKEAARGKGENPIAPNPNLNFRLGSGFSGGRFFNGALDDFRIYGRALSANEVQALMQDEGSGGK